MNTQEILFDELKRVLSELGETDSQQDDSELLAVLKANYRLKKPELASILEMVQGKSRSADSDKKRETLLSQLDGYLKVLQIRVRNLDLQNPDLKKLKIAISNRKSQMKKLS